METIYIILIAVVVTIVVYESIKKLYKFLSCQFGRVRSLECRTDFHDTNIVSALKDIKQLNKLEKDYRITEKLAKNFDRDIESYHISLRRLDEVQLIHAKMISALEKKIK